MNEADWARLDRVLAGEATDAERARVEAWAARDPRHAALLAALREDATFGATAEADTEAAWLRLREALREPAALEPAPSRRVWLRAAAVAALLLTGTLLWRAAAPPAGVDRVVTAGTVPDTIVLEDGSTVILAPGSRLAWRDPFARAARRIALDGEALFEVAADAERPFTIDAAPLAVTVLGTRFVLRAWPEHARAGVAVTEGRVRVASSAGSTVLEADQALAYEAGAVSVRTGFDVAVETAWVDGRLAFDDSPLGDVLPRLARRFDLEFVLADAALERRRVTATFDAPDADRILDALGLALNVRFERDGRRVRVVP